MQKLHHISFNCAMQHVFQRWYTIAVE